MSAPLTICCLYSIFHLALKLFSCHFQGHNLKGHPKIEPTADLYSRLYATAQLCLSALHAHHFTFFSLRASFFCCFFGFLFFLSPESGEIFNEALEGLHCSTGQPRQLLTSLAAATTTSRAAAASRSSISVGALLPRPKQVKGSQTY